jgi:hypothetical protein|tara:strand:- start:134 stop:730 length:597 start_codon:yes stop_codon:yes gene_type:complete
MVNSSYTYSDGNLLKNPQKYQMTPFLDKNFLNDYQRTRINYLEKISKFEKIELKKIIHNINQKDMQEDRNGKFNSVTSIMLFDVLTALINDENNNFDIIDKFIKKFETKKLIFSKYDDNLQPISNEYSEIRNYLLLATICVFKFKNSKNLKYLNTLLKLNDTICSQINSIDNSIDASLCNIVITNEQNFIADLIQKKC